MSSFFARSAGGPYGTRKADGASRGQPSGGRLGRPWESPAPRRRRGVLLFLVCRARDLTALSLRCKKRPRRRKRHPCVAKCTGRGFSLTSPFLLPEGAFWMYAPTRVSRNERKNGWRRVGTKRAKAPFLCPKRRHAPPKMPVWRGRVGGTAQKTWERGAFFPETPCNIGRKVL